MESLFGNPGRKIKVVSFVWFILEVIAAVITGFVMFSESALAGLLIIIFGTAVAYLMTLILYAYGELVEKMTKTEENTRSAKFYANFNATYQGGDQYAQQYNPYNQQYNQQYTQQYAPQYDQQYGQQYNQYAQQYTQQQYAQQQYAPQYNQQYTQTYDIDQELQTEENRIEKLSQYNGYVASRYAELQNDLLNGVISKGQYLAQLKEIQ